MNAEYPWHSVRLDRDSGVLRAEIEVRNASGAVWRAADGFAIGVHLFDDGTGTLVVDGERIHPAHDIPPGESARVVVSVAAPREDGSYRAMFSPMREGDCWYYERGWPFVAADVSVRDGSASLGPVRVTTQKSLRRARACRSLWRAVVYPPRTIWRNRSLIYSMSRRDVLGRYRGSIGGAFWTVLSPLLLMLTYFFVFGVVLRARDPSIPGKTGFALYFLAGMAPWLAISEAVGRAPGVMLEHRNFVKKLVFETATLPVNLVAAAMVTELFAILLFCGFLLLLRGAIPATALWLPALLIPQLLLTAGLCWFLAALGVFVRDLGQLIGFALTIWFFLTPICYTEASLAGLPHFAAILLSKNPLYILVEGYRAIFLRSQAPAFASLWKLWVVSALTFVLGHAWFYKMRRSFPDIM